MRGRPSLPLLVALVALLLALWSASEVTWRRPVAPASPVVSVQEKAALRALLRELDRRLTVVERELVRQTGEKGTGP